MKPKFNKTNFLFLLLILIQVQLFCGLLDENKMLLELPTMIVDYYRNMYLHPYFLTKFVLPIFPNHKEYYSVVPLTVWRYCGNSTIRYSVNSDGSIDVTVAESHNHYNVIYDRPADQEDIQFLNQKGLYRKQWEEDINNVDLLVEHSNGIEIKEVISKSLISWFFSEKNKEYVIKLIDIDLMNFMEERKSKSIIKYELHAVIKQLSTSNSKDIDSIDTIGRLWDIIVWIDVIYDSQDKECLSKIIEKANKELSISENFDEFLLQEQVGDIFIDEIVESDFKLKIEIEKIFIKSGAKYYNFCSSFKKRLESSLYNKGGD